MVFGPRSNTERFSSPVTPPLSSNQCGRSRAAAPDWRLVFHSNLHTPFQKNIHIAPSIAALSLHISSPFWPLMWTLTEVLCLYLHSCYVAGWLDTYLDKQVQRCLSSTATHRFESHLQENINLYLFINLKMLLYEKGKHTVIRSFYCVWKMN